MREKGGGQKGVHPSAVSELHKTPNAAGAHQPAGDAAAAKAAELVAAEEAQRGVEALDKGEDLYRW